MAYGGWPRSRSRRSGRRWRPSWPEAAASPISGSRCGAAFSDVLVTVLTAGLIVPARGDLRGGRREISSASISATSRRRSHSCDPPPPAPACLGPPVPPHRRSSLCHCCCKRRRWLSPGRASGSAVPRRPRAGARRHGCCASGAQTRTGSPQAAGSSTEWSPAVPKPPPT